MSTARAEGRTPSLPITRGSLMDFPADPIACMRRLHARHGSLGVLEEDGQQIVFAFGQKWNQQILTDEKTFLSRFFSLRGSRNSAQRRLTSGLLSMNGPEHKRDRRLVMGPFQKMAIAGYQQDIAALTAAMLDGWQIGQVRNIHQDMTQYMLRVTSSILFGFDVPELAYRIGHMIDHWVDLNHRTGLGALQADPNITMTYDQLLDHAEELETAIRQMIELRRADSQGATDVLSLLIRANAGQASGNRGQGSGNRGQGSGARDQLPFPSPDSCLLPPGRRGGLGDDKLIGHVALLFGAAHLTTAHTLTWTLFLLAQHPEVMRELHEELAREESGAGQPASSPPATLMQRVIKESMRVLPASGYLHRNVALPVQMGPLRLDVGTPVVFSQYMTHHLAELYDDPDTFRPDRWLSISPSPYAYLPFGAGPRMCIGGPLAMMILGTALPAILKRYRLSVVAGSEISGRIVSSMLGPVTAVPMQVSAPDANFQAVPVTGNIASLVHLPGCFDSARQNRRAA